MPIDPVCGMTVDEKTAPASTVHHGTTYYFCAPGCKRTFDKDPEAVVRGGATATERGCVSGIEAPVLGGRGAERAGHAPGYVGAPRPARLASGFLLAAVAADDAGAVLGRLAIL